MNIKKFFVLANVFGAGFILIVLLFP